MARFPKIFRGLSDILFIGSEKVREVLNDRELHHHGEYGGARIAHVAERPETSTEAPKFKIGMCSIVPIFQQGGVA